MNNFFKNYVRNQYLLGKDIFNLSEIEERYGKDSKEFVAYCIVGTKAEGLSYTETFDVYRAYYGKLSAKIGALKKKFEFENIEDFMRSKKMIILTKDKVEPYNLQYIRAFAEYIKGYPDRLIEIDSQKFTFFEYAGFLAQEFRFNELNKESELVRTLSTCMPIYKEENRILDICCGVYTGPKKEKDLTYEALAYALFPVDINTDILYFLMEQYRINKTMDISINENANMLLPFILSETLKKSFRDIMSIFSFTDLSKCMKGDFIIYKCFENNYTVMYKDETVKVVNRNELINIIVG